MFIVVRNDLPPGLQAAQAVHAGFLFAQEHPDETNEWHNTSQFVVILQVPDLDSLIDRFKRLPSSVARVMFHEADLDDDATAFAALGHEAGSLLSDLPLALKEVAMS